MTLLLFIFVLGIIIFVHELGHFLFAKKAGIYVHEFSLGMGPQIFKFHRKNDETEYSIRLFPIGGFVSIAGEEVEIDKNVPKGKNLQEKSWLQRFLVMVAGATFNFLFAILVLFLIALFVGGETLTPTIGTLTTDYPAALSDIETGDKILKINHKNVFTWDDAIIRMNEKKAINEVVLELETVDGVKKTVTLVPKIIVLVQAIQHDEIKPGYFLLKVNGNEVTSLEHAKSLIDGQEATVTIYDGNQEKDYQIKEEHQLKIIETRKYGIGQGVKETHGFFNAISYAFQKFASLMLSMFITVGDLLTGQIGLENMAGPVGIYDIVGQEAQAGAGNLFLLIAYLSINVGFINLIPFPAFDGGKVLFLVID